MGEAKIRKKLEPNYGKGNQVISKTTISKTEILEHIQSNYKFCQSHTQYKPDFGLYFYEKFDFTPIVLGLNKINGIVSNEQEGYIGFEANFRDGIARLGTVIVPKYDLSKVRIKIENSESLIIFPDVNDISREKTGLYYLPFKPDFTITDIQEYREKNKIKYNFYIEI